MPKQKQRATASPDRPLDFADPLLTRKQLAEALGVTERWVARSHEMGRLPYVKVGKLIRFRRSDVIKYIEANRIDPTQDGQ